jgi:4-hydroxy-tetrahydrodipicolinate reductase
VERAANGRGHDCVAILDPAHASPAGARGAELAASRQAEVAFEFTTPRAASGNVEALLRAGIPVVCGTTGWDPAAKKIDAALRAGGATLIAEPNFSVGMHLFAGVVALAARAFGGTRLYDPWIVESHHRGKADAPSGTARRLAQVVQEEGPRDAGAPQVTSVRAGHEPGTHTVGFDGEHDLVTLTHRARGRGGFALGAVLAAEWLRGKKGRHTFAEVVEDLIAEPRRKKKGRSA